MFQWRAVGLLPPRATNQGAAGRGPRARRRHESPHGKDSVSLTLGDVRRSSSPEAQSASRGPFGPGCPPGQLPYAGTRRVLRVDPIPWLSGFPGSMNHPSWDDITSESIVASPLRSGQSIDLCRSIRTRRDGIASKKTRNRAVALIRTTVGAKSPPLRQPTRRGRGWRGRHARRTKFRPRKGVDPARQACGRTPAGPFNPAQRASV